MPKTAQKSEELKLEEDKIEAKAAVKSDDDEGEDMASEKKKKDDDEDEDDAESKAKAADDDDDADADAEDDAEDGKKKAKAKAKGSQSWFKVIAARVDGDITSSSAPEILVYDEIGGFGQTALDFQNALKGLGNPSEITMRINSPGGNSFDGIAIHNMLAAHPAKVTAHIDGIAASAASLIAMAADKIVAPKNSFMVIHNPSALTYGDATSHRAMADDLDRVTESYARTYSKRSGQGIRATKALMSEDRLMGAEEAQSLGYVDECTEPKMMAATFALDKIPEKFRSAASIFAKPAAEAKIDPVEPVIEAKAAPVVAAKVEEPEAPAYGQAEIDETLALCEIAAAPIALATRFIGAKTPLADVRAALLAQRAAKKAEVIFTEAVIELEPKKPDPRVADETIVARKREIQKSLRHEMGIRAR